MAIPHAIPGQVLDVRPLGEQLLSVKSTALFKSCDLEVIRLVLLAGKSLPAHLVPGESTILCLEGSLSIQLGARTVTLQAGEMMLIARSAAHGLTALTDASALVTIALKPSFEDAPSVTPSVGTNSGAASRSDHHSCSADVPESVQPLKPGSWDGLFAIYPSTTVPADFMGEADRTPAAHDRDPFADMPKPGQT